MMDSREGVLVVVLVAHVRRQRLSRSIDRVDTGENQGRSHRHPDRALPRPRGTEAWTLMTSTSRRGFRRRTPCIGSIGPCFPGLSNRGQAHTTWSLSSFTDAIDNDVAMVRD